MSEILAGIDWSFLSSIDTIEGLIAVREWSCDGLLHSTFAAYRWKSPEVTSDKQPALINQNGIYCRTLENYKDMRGDYVGIVELRGEILWHTDDVLRAEWCRILRLFVHQDANEALLAQLHSVYGVPMVVTNSAPKSIEKWLEGEGKTAFKHNAKILEQYGGSLEAVYGKPNVTREKYKTEKEGVDISSYSAVLKLMQNGSFLSTSYAFPLFGDADDDDDSKDTGSDKGK
jgi:hypothetical protein